jgi:hypothetical protein
MQPIQRISTYVGVFLGLLLAVAPGCRREEPVSTTEVILAPVKAVPEAPDDAAWRTAPEHLAKLILQDMVEPRLMTPSTPHVRVRALTDGRDVAFRLEWPDSTHNDRNLPGEFADACAIQLPATITPDVPAPQMGEYGRPVEIAFWSAAWQAEVDGRGDTITDRYPHASIDHYAYEAPPLKDDPVSQQELALLYAPARAVRNPVAGPRTSAVDDLIAAGPGTVMPALNGNSRGQGQRTPDGWAVVITRRLPEGLSGHTRGQIALAVWDGAREEAGARKMRTGWIPVTLEQR